MGTSLKLSALTLDLSIVSLQLLNTRVICIFFHTMLHMESFQYLHDNCCYMKIQLMANVCPINHQNHHTIPKVLCNPILCQYINYHPDCIIATRCTRQFTYKIHNNHIPLSLWDRWLLQQSWGPMMFELHQLTNKTLDQFNSCSSFIIDLLSMLMCVRLPVDFILKASATTFALPGW